jgi:hypothetical protein
MMRTVIGAITLAAAMAHSVHAITDADILPELQPEFIGEGYEITDIIEEGNGSISGLTFESQPLTAYEEEANLLAMAGARAYKSVGHANSNIQMFGYHTLTIYNYTPYTQQYRVDYNLKGREGNFHYAYTANVGGNSSFITKANSSLTEFFPNRGIYGIRATTEITGESSDTQSSSAWVEAV